LDKEHIILIISLILLLPIGLSVCQEIPMGTSGSTAPRQIAVSSTDTIDRSSVTQDANVSSESAPNLRYVWSVTGIESDQVIMALNQDGDELFGQASYEPDAGSPWNGVVAGFISGDSVHLVITALKGDELVSAALDGLFADDTIAGKFFLTSEGNMSAGGEFDAVWINPDLSSYTPAKIRRPTQEIPDASNATAPSGVNQTYPQRTMYHDVHQDADRIMTGVGDISQIPIGMGGSGLA
jgi:hypothetical protein